MRLQPCQPIVPLFGDPIDMRTSARPPSFATPALPIGLKLIECRFQCRSPRVDRRLQLCFVVLIDAKLRCSFGQTIRSVWLAERPC